MAHKYSEICQLKLMNYNQCLQFILCKCRGRARTQAPTTRNYTVELPTFAVIAGVSPSVVQCKSLTLEETPRWSGLTSPSGKYANFRIQMRAATLIVLTLVGCLDLPHERQVRCRILVCSCMDDCKKCDPFQASSKIIYFWAIVGRHRL